MGNSYAYVCRKPCSDPYDVRDEPIVEQTSWHTYHESLNELGREPLVGPPPRLLGSPQRYGQKDLSTGHSDRTAMPPSYTGLPGTPVGGAATGNTQRQSLPGESVLVTYDGMGQSNSLMPPGESMVVTSPFQDARDHRTIPPGGIASGTPRSGSMGRVTAEKSLTSLEPTKTFHLKDPYKIGDKVEIWSQSNNGWCAGAVQKYQGEYVQVFYQSPSGQTISKVMPNGHEHLRFHGHYHGPGDPNSAPGHPNPPPGDTTPGDGTPWRIDSYHQRPPLLPEQCMPSYGSQIPTSPREIAPGINSPVAANGAYRVGDKIQMFSISQNTWVDGSVQMVISKPDGEWITISYKGPGGHAMTKIMPHGHEHVRAAQSQQFGSMLPEMTPTLLTETSNWMHWNEARTEMTPALDAGLPPSNKAYKVGDLVEIFSASQNAWCKGQISKDKVDTMIGDYVHVVYRGVKGEPRNKIMPNGHEHLRLRYA